MQLLTDYKIDEIPHSEHPRPQFQRDAYLSLNGKWSFGKCRQEEEITPTGEILVPFSPESALSGVEEGFVLGKDEKLVYEREFVIDEGLTLGRTLLHFGAVDQYCEVSLNGTIVGTHKGGFTPFAIDVTSAVQIGRNTLRVECVDRTEDSHGARGKQSEKRGGIWYTAQSGIWQSVWLESMPKDCVTDFTVKTDALKKTVTISVDAPSKVTLCVFDGAEKIYEQESATGEFTLSHDFVLWSPDTPKLYDFTLTTEGGDKVYSYFGVRSVSTGTDAEGKARLYLNGKPYFFNGLLDQGYFSDGLLTYPCEKCIEEELTTLKKMGFNTLRKHIKVEPMRWYYLCDKLGILVWQDFVNGGGRYINSHVTVFPFLGIKHKDDDYAYFSREKAEGRYEFMQGMAETVTALKNSPSVVLWTVFNEGWGQFDSAQVTEKLKELDDTRLIDSVSGWHDQGVGKTTLRSLHTYFTPLRVPKDPRPVVLSEFGGYSLPVEGHQFSQKIFGYKVFKTEQKLHAALKKLYLEKVKPLIKKGLCACIYTQASDVEEEINGLVTYDRKYWKVPVEFMQGLNAALREESEKVK